jgi:cation diffusion facilitator CzcD-associated flavoprotein CzcO
MHVHNTIIIGSGISGIFTLKHLIEEGNKNVLVLDKNPQPFGVWDVNNPHGVFENTHTVSSRLYMTISDYPMPENTPEFPHHSLILNSLLMPAMSS